MITSSSPPLLLQKHRSPAKKTSNQSTQLEFSGKNPLPRNQVSKGAKYKAQREQSQAKRQNWSIGGVGKNLFISWLLLTAGIGKAFGAQPNANLGRLGSGEGHNGNASGLTAPNNGTMSESLQHMPFPFPPLNDQPFVPADLPKTEEKPSNHPRLRRLLASNCNDAADLLRCPPFPPTNTSLFSPQIYNDSPVYEPAPYKLVSSYDMADELETLFNTRFNGNETQVQEALDLYMDTSFRVQIPDPKLRAAVVALKGTFAEKAIDVFKSDTFSRVSFKELDPGIIAAVDPHLDTGEKPEVYVNRRYAGEDFRLLASSMAHEALHMTDPNSTDTISGHEEFISHSLDALVHLQFLSENSTLAEQPTELAQRVNTKALARINSRDPEGNLRLYQAQGNVYPGGRPLNKWSDAITIIDPEQTSEGPELLASYLEGATGIKVKHPDFDPTTSALIDEHQVALNSEQVLNAAKTLKLDTNCTPPPKNETDKPSVVPTDEPPPAASSATRASVPGLGLITAAAGLTTSLMNRLLNRNPAENA